MSSHEPLYASADLGGTNIAALLANEAGHVIANGTIPIRSYEGPEAVVDRIGTLIKSLQQQAGRPPVALGIGVPGLANLPAGETYIRVEPSLLGDQAGPLGGIALAVRHGLLHELAAT